MAKRKDIGSKREVKIKVSVKDVEEHIDELLIKYNLNEQIETYIGIKLDDCLNSVQINKNCKLKTARGYKYQFDNDLFNDICEYLLPIIRKATETELASVDIDGTGESEKYLKLKIIYDNIFDTVELTMYKEGVEKLKLVAWHYLTKLLEKRAEIIIKDYEIKNVRGYKTPIEVFSFELMGIIGQNDELEKFTLTLKSLIEQWLVKYNNKSKIGQFYYSILMINQDHIIEKILRYLLFTAIKNFNPIYLRAIFSTYLTLIHKNIFSFYALKLTNVKVGYFKQLESLFEDDITDNTNKTNVTQMIIQNRTLTYALQNKRFLKHNYEFLIDEQTSSFLDINYFDLLYSYKKSFNILDYHYYYSSFLKLTNNSFRSQSKQFKINSDFYKPMNKRSLKIYLNELIIDELYDSFFNVFKNKETVLAICESIGINMLKKINQQNFTSASFRKILMSFDEYLEQLSQVINNMKKLID